MPEAPARTPKKTPLKIWNDWSAGVGFAKDGEAPGMYKAAGLLGLPGELRVAPFLNTVATGIVEALSTYLFVNTTLAFSHMAVSLLPAASSTIATQGSTYTGKVATNTTLTYSATVAAYTNGILVVTVANNSAADPTGVTFNGDALTKVAAGVGNPRTSIWYRVAPDVATGDVVVTFAAATHIVSSAQLYTGVHQASPIGAGQTGSGTASQGFNTEVMTDAQLNGMMVDSCVVNTTSDNLEPEATQTEILDDSQTAIRAKASYRAQSNAGIWHFMYFAEAVANTDDTHPFLYCERGDRLGGRAVIHKVDLSNADFATFEAGSLPMATVRFAGQPAKYQGFWWWPAGNDNTPRKLSVVGTGDATTDTLDAPVTPFEPGADHLTSFANQMAGVVAQGVAGVPGLGGVGAQDGGVRILVIDGTPSTSTDWGSEFPTGDVTDRAGGLLNLGGATYVMMPDGLYSFNAVGRSGLVLSDLGEWRNFHQNILWSAWKGGIVITHPSGLIFYVPGEEPEYAGIGAGRGAQALPPAGVTTIYGGYYHSSAPRGNYVYVVYQPDPSSTSALLICGYQGTPGAGVTWQGLASLTLQEIRTELGCHVATSGRPRADTFVTPTVWTQSGASLVYVTLDGSGGPFRERADTHKVAQSASAVMSELFFEQPVDLDEIVAYTQDMGSSDEFQLSLIVNGTGNEANVGRPFVGDGRDSRPLNYKRVHRLTLIVTFTTTDTTARVPPAVSRIELFGGVS